MKFDRQKIKIFIVKLSLVIFSLMLFWLIYLDGVVKDEFKTTAWQLPATIYARPLPLAKGSVLSISAFKMELQYLGYRQVIKAVNQGEYERYGQSFVIKLRDFQFWDGHQPSQIIQLTFKDGKIYDLKDFQSNQKIHFLRLDPMLLGYMQTGRTEDREIIPLAKVPQQLVAALMLIEDRDFYSHFGVSPKGIARALWQNMSSGSVRQGGSTLTQQLMKNHFLSSERSLWRKAQEAMMALLTEIHYPKDTILEAYINEIYLGQNRDVSVHGFARAAGFYFDKKLSDLDTAQIALLVALVKGPSYYNPRKHSRRAKERRNLVLKLMAEHQIISQSQLNESLSQSLHIVAKPPLQTAKVPALKQLLRRELGRDYSQQALQSEGLKLFTSIDPILQKDAESSLMQGVDNLDPGRKQSLQGALLSIDYRRGEVVAIVGGRDPDYVGFNRVLDARRQTGSVIKPFVYLTAIERPESFNLETLLEDKALTLKGSDGSFWTPQNYDKKLHGRVSLEQALTHSYNLATARLALKLGIDKVVKRIKSLGFDGELPAYPSLALGAKEMTVFELSQLYQPLANGGAAITPSVILAVSDSKGQLLHRYPQKAEQKIDPEAAFILRFAMSKVLEEGTARSIGRQLSRRYAAKTGTTNDLRDSWFAGFGGKTLTVIWLGRDDNQPTRYTGASGAGRIWLNYYQRINEPELSLDPPAGIVWALPERNWLSRLTDCEPTAMKPFYRDYVNTDYEICD